MGVQKSRVSWYWGSSLVFILFVLFLILVVQMQKYTKQRASFNQRTCSCANAEDVLIDCKCYSTHSGINTTRQVAGSTSAGVECISPASGKYTLCAPGDDSAACLNSNITNPVAAPSLSSTESSDIVYDADETPSLNSLYNSCAHPKCASGDIPVSLAGTNMVVCKSNNTKMNAAIKKLGGSCPSILYDYVKCNSEMCYYHTVNTSTVQKSRGQCINECANVNVSALQSWLSDQYGENKNLYEAYYSTPDEKVTVGGRTYCVVRNPIVHTFHLDNGVSKDGLSTCMKKIIPMAGLKAASQSFDGMRQSVSNSMFQHNFSGTDGATGITGKQLVYSSTTTPVVKKYYDVLFGGKGTVMPNSCQNSFESPTSAMYNYPFLGTGLACSPPNSASLSDTNTFWVKGYPNRGWTPCPGGACPTTVAETYMGPKGMFTTTNSCTQLFNPPGKTMASGDSVKVIAPTTACQQQTVPNPNCATAQGVQLKPSVYPVVNCSQLGLGNNKIPGTGELGPNLAQFKNSVKLVPCDPNHAGKNTRSYYDPYTNGSLSCGGPLICKLSDTSVPAPVAAYLKGCPNPNYTAGACTCGRPEDLDAAIQSGVVKSGINAKNYTFNLYQSMAPTSNNENENNRMLNTWGVGEKGSLPLLLPGTTITAWAYTPKYTQSMANAINSSCIYNLNVPQTFSGKYRCPTSTKNPCPTLGTWSGSQCRGDCVCPNDWCCCRTLNNRKYTPGNTWRNVAIQIGNGSYTQLTEDAFSKQNLYG